MQKHFTWLHYQIITAGTVEKFVYVFVWLILDNNYISIINFPDSQFFERLWISDDFQYAVEKWMNFNK